LGKKKISHHVPGKLSQGVSWKKKRVRQGNRARLGPGGCRGGTDQGKKDSKGSGGKFVKGQSFDGSVGVAGYPKYRRNIGSVRYSRSARRKKKRRTTRKGRRASRGTFLSGSNMWRTWLQKIRSNSNGGSGEKNTNRRTLQWGSKGVDFLGARCHIITPGKGWKKPTKTGRKKIGKVRAGYGC